MPVTINERLLKIKMLEKDVDVDALCAAVGIDVSTFYRKKTGKSDFYRNEIRAIRCCLDLSDDDVESIFFAPTYVNASSSTKCPSENNP